MFKLKSRNLLTVCALAISILIATCGALLIPPASAASMQNSYAELSALTEADGSIKLSVNFLNKGSNNGFRIMAQGNFLNTANQQSQYKTFIFNTPQDVYQLGKNVGISYTNFTAGAYSVTFGKALQGWFFNESPKVTVNMINGETYSILLYFCSGIEADEGDEWVNETQVATLSYSHNPPSLPPAPIKEGYSFVGWYLDVGLTVPYTNQPITSDMNFYAKFSPIVYSISYTLNGGSLTGSANSYTIETNTFNLSEPTKTGYSFGGWYENASFTGSAVTTITKGSIGNRAFYAKWTLVNYTITYNTNGGSLTGHNTSYNIESPNVVLATPTKAGHTFLGWFTSGDFSGSSVIQINNGSTGNKEYYAKWEINKYTVFFNSTGGSEVTSVTVDYGSSVTQPTTTRTGYKFLGWYKDAGGVNQFNFSTSVVETDMTLYAKWEILQFSVKFYVDGVLYHTTIVDYGTTLGDAVAQAEQELFQFLSVLTSIDSTSVILEDVDLDVNTQTSGLAKLGSQIDYLFANYGAIILTIGICAVVVLAIVFGGKRGYKRTSRARSYKR